MKTSPLALLALASIALAPPARAGAAVGATEFTQLLNNGLLTQEVATQVEQLVQQMQIVRNQIAEYELLVRNIQSLPEREWSGAADVLLQIKEITERARGLAYLGANAAEIFEQKHPSFQQYLKNGITSQQYRDAYTEWDARIMDSVQAVGNILLTSNANIDPTKDLLDQLRSDSVGATGQKAAIQAGNQIAALQVQQMLVLRQLISTQLAQQQEVISKERSESAASRAAREQAFRKTKKWNNGNQKSY